MLQGSDFMYFNWQFMHLLVFFYYARKLSWGSHQVTKGGILNVINKYPASSLLECCFPYWSPLSLTQLAFNFPPLSSQHLNLLHFGALMSQGLSTIPTCAPEMRWDHKAQNLRSIQCNFSQKENDKIRSRKIMTKLLKHEKRPSKLKFIICACDYNLSIVN